MNASTSRFRNVCLGLGYFCLAASFLLAVAIGWSRDIWSPIARENLLLVAIALFVPQILVAITLAVWKGKEQPRQFSLRTFLVTGVLSIGTGACLGNLWFAVAEDRAVAPEIDRLLKMDRLTIDSSDRPALKKALHRSWHPSKNLRSLKIHHQPISDVLMKNVAGSHQLQSLELTDCNLSDDHLVYLASLNGLKWLSLENTNITDGGLRHLANLPNLRLLRLRGTNVTGDGIPVLAELPQLRTLDIGNTPITPAGLRNINSLENLTTLHLEDVELDAIPGRPQYLWIKNARLSPNAFKEISQLEELYCLHLSNTNLSDAELPAIASLPNLTFLDLSNTRLTDEGFLGVEPMASLNRVSLAGTAVGDGAAAFLSECPRVHVVNLDRTGVSDTGAKLLSRLTNNLAGQPRLGEDGTPLPPETEPVYVSLHKTAVSKAAVAWLRKSIGTHPEYSEGPASMSGVNTQADPEDWPSFITDFSSR